MKSRDIGQPLGVSGIGKQLPGRSWAAFFWRWQQSKCRSERDPMLGRDPVVQGWSPRVPSKWGHDPVLTGNDPHFWRVETPGTQQSCHNTKRFGPRQQ